LIIDRNEFSYPGMPPQFQALRAPVKQSRWVGAVLVPFKTVPYPIERKSDPRIGSTILGTHNSISGGKLYVSLHKFERILPPTKVGGGPAAFVLKRFKPKEERMELKVNRRR